MDSNEYSYSYSCLIWLEGIAHAVGGAQDSFYCPSSLGTSFTWVGAIPGGLPGGSYQNDDLPDLTMTDTTQKGKGAEFGPVWKLVRRSIHSGHR